jgi:ribosomal protein S18 acetylase RimI-like enzyme
VLAATADDGTLFRHQIGSVMVHAKGNTSIEVTDLGVDQAHREQGIGKALIAAAARTGLQLGKATVVLAAPDKGSGRLTQWYKRMGFAQVGMHQNGYPQLEAPMQGDYERSGKLLQESLALFREQEIMWGIIWALISLGDVALDQGSSAQALGPIQEALVLTEGLGDTYGNR